MILGALISLPRWERFPLEALKLIVKSWCYRIGGVMLKFHSNLYTLVVSMSYFCALLYLFCLSSSTTHKTAILISVESSLNSLLVLCSEKMMNHLFFCYSSGKFGPFSTPGIMYSVVYYWTSIHSNLLI